MSAGLASVAAVTDDTITTDSFLMTGDSAAQAGHIVWTETGVRTGAVKYRLDFAFVWQREADGVWRIERDLDFEGPLK